MGRAREIRSRSTSRTDIQCFPVRRRAPKLCACRSCEGAAQDQVLSVRLDQADGGRVDGDVSIVDVVEVEVVKVAETAGDDHWAAGRRALRVDGEADEKLLVGAGVVKMALGVVDSVDADRGHIPGYGLHVAQVKDLGRCAGVDVEAPDEAEDGVGDEDQAGLGVDVRHAVELGSVGKVGDFAYGRRRPCGGEGCHVDFPHRHRPGDGLERGVVVVAARDVEDVGPRLGEAEQTRDGGREGVDDDGRSVAQRVDLVGGGLGGATARISPVALTAMLSIQTPSPMLATVDAARGSDDRAWTRAQRTEVKSRTSCSDLGIFPKQVRE